MNQYVYILSNPSLPSLHKIGYTANSIEERMEQLYSTGVPTKFELEFCIEVVNGLGTEQLFHKLFLPKLAEEVNSNQQSALLQTKTFR